MNYAKAVILRKETVPEVVPEVVPEEPYAPKYYDCVIRSRRDEHTNGWWKAMDTQYLADKMVIPELVRPMIRGVADGWSGFWPVSTIGITYEESDAIREWCRSTLGWKEATPPLSFIYKPLHEGGPVRSSHP